MHKWKNTEPNKKKTKTIAHRITYNAEKNNSLRRNKNKKKQHMAKYKWKKMEITRVDEAKKERKNIDRKKEWNELANAIYRSAWCCCAVILL